MKNRSRENKRIKPGHYELTLDDDTYTIMKVVDCVKNGKEICFWDVSFGGEVINTMDKLSQSIGWVEGLHKETRQENFGYRMLPE